ncbi:hypothetical protein SAY86_000166 [Trapa natans]|uniref:Uncharacterized protein n=1 Tax=Trapa natans TaxID=22666 RepID=A0AAN7RMM3_TRANT|nr:hypothetical protein SAY86_000166 [Trapa natans]
MYEAMKERIENVLSEGKVGEELITGDGARQALRRWTLNFTRDNHPPVIQVLVDNSRDRDANGDPMPNLIYVSRGKSHTEPHNFKAGALNALAKTLIGLHSIFINKVSKF